MALRRNAKSVGMWLIRSGERIPLIRQGRRRGSGKKTTLRRGLQSYIYEAIFGGGSELDRGEEQGEEGPDSGCE